MRCPVTLCQSSNTKLIERTLELPIQNNVIVNAYIKELWLCNNCGNPFHPSVMKIMPGI